MKNNKFPALNQYYEADYGNLKFNVYFYPDGNTLKWAPSGVEDFDSQAVVEKYVSTWIRDNIYWVTWKEQDGTTVSHIEDFENNVVYASITTNSNFLTLTGKWNKIGKA